MKLEKVVRILPLGAVILIGLGILRTSIYYNYFGIDIMSYLSTSEVLTFFLNDFQPLIVLAIIAFIHIVLSERMVEKIDKKIGSEKFVQIIIEKKSWVLGINVVFLFLISTNLIFDYQEINYIMIYSFPFCLASLFVLLFNGRIYKNSELNDGIMNIGIGLIITTIIPLFSLRDIRRIENNQGKKVRLLTSRNQLVYSSKQNIYLGKAGENFFFFNPRKRISTIYRLDNIQEIKIKN
ncbi:MAG: hypothetical protein RLZZ585_1980 [Bacteroidota bacterium]|jgi:hypothetical protein